MTVVSNTLVFSLVLAIVARYLAVVSTTGAFLLVGLAVVSVIKFFPLVADKTIMMLDRCHLTQQKCMRVFNIDLYQMIVYDFWDSVAFTWLHTSFFLNAGS